MPAPLDSLTKPETASGFTLIEMLVTLAVAAVFLAIAVPSYRAMINRNAVATQVNTYLTDLNYMRSEAITRNQPVRMCKSADGQSCAAKGGWQQGRIVFANADGNGSPSADELLRVRPATAGLRIVGNGNLENFAEFDANGFALGSAGTLAFCDTDGSDSATDLVVSTSGRVRSQPDQPDCTP